MQVLLGNADPTLPAGETRDAPCVTYINIPSGAEHYPEGHHGYVQVVDPEFTGDHLRAHLADALLDADGRVTHLPGHEPVLAVASPFGHWRQNAKIGTKPLWVWSDDDEVERILSEYWKCPRGVPGDVEATHHTLGGAPGLFPGLNAPAADFELEANITQNGRDIQARNAYGQSVSAIGSGTAATATTFTTASTYTLNQWAGFRVYAYSTTGGIVWANVISNTAGANSVLTVDRWYAPATPGGVAGTTPTTPWGFIISDGGAPAWFMGLSTSTTTLGTPSTNTTLPSEITTAGGGLVRQIATWSHTASAATTTLVTVSTTNGSDSLPVIIGSIGIGNSMVPTSTPNLYFNTLFATTATLSAVGDQLTSTDTITGT